MASVVNVSAPGGILDSIVTDKAYSLSNPLTYHFGLETEDAWGFDPINQVFQADGTLDDFFAQTETLRAFSSMELFTNVDFQQAANQGASDLTYWGVEGLAIPNGGAALNGAFTSPGALILPNGHPRAGEAVAIGYIESADPVMTVAEFTGSGGFRSRVVLHETGHALGLSHVDGTDPDSPVALEATLQNERYTVMSRGTDSFATLDAQFGHAVSYMALDIAALQYLYGVDNQAHLGSTEYTLTGASSSIALDLEGSDGSISVGRAYYSIWDSGGDDTIAYDLFRDVVINLNEATLSTTLDPSNAALAEVLTSVQATSAFAALDSDVQQRMIDSDYFAGGFLSQALNTDGTAVDGGYTIANGAVIENARGNTGDDLLIGNEHANELSGGAGNDTLIGGFGNDMLIGGDGRDILDGGTGDDTVEGGAGNDAIELGAGLNFAFGQGGNDTVQGGSSVDEISGGAGSDTLSGNGGNDIIDGDTGGDTVFGGDGNDTIFGGSAGDTLDGGAGDDIINGEGFTDILNGGFGNDTLSGGGSADELYGDAGNDTLNGNNASDFLSGGGGNDTLNGGQSNDELRGGSGNDELLGSTGDDRLYGDDGADTFQFRANHGSDRIFDFEQGTDVIQFNIGSVNDISDLTFTNVFAGVDISYGSGSIRVLGSNDTDFTNADFEFL